MLAKAQVSHSIEYSSGTPPGSAGKLSLYETWGAPPQTRGQPAPAQATPRSSRSPGPQSRTPAHHLPARPNPEKHQEPADAGCIHAPLRTARQARTWPFHPPPAPRTGSLQVSTPHAPPGHLPPYIRGRGARRPREHLAGNRRNHPPVVEEPAGRELPHIAAFGLLCRSGPAPGSWGGVRGAHGAPRRPSCRSL